MGWLGTFSCWEGAGKSTPIYCWPACKWIQSSWEGNLAHPSNVKAFSLAVLFIILIRTHSQVQKADRTRIYRDTTLSVVKKIQYHLKPYCSFIKHSIKLRKSTFKMKAFCAMCMPLCKAKAISQAWTQSMKNNLYSSMRVGSLRSATYSEIE